MPRTPPCQVVTINEFDLYRFLGAGGFGMVLLSKKKDTGKFYAIKVIDKRILISQNQVRPRSLTPHERRPGPFPPLFRSP